MVITEPIQSRALPPILSYIKVALEFGRPRYIREVSHFSASLDQFFTYHWSTGLYVLFFISIFLIVFAKLKENEYLKIFIFITLVGFVFSLGPVLKWQQDTFKIGELFSLPTELWMITRKDSRVEAMLTDSILSFKKKLYKILTT